MEEYRHGVLLTINGVVRWLVPYISSVATDWPEGQQQTGHFEGAVNANANCRKCKRKTSEFADTSAPRPGEARIQNVTEQMRAYARGELANEDGSSPSRIQREDLMKVCSSASSSWMVHCRVVTALPPPAPL